MLLTTGIDALLNTDVPLDICNWGELSEDDLLGGLEAEIGFTLSASGTWIHSSRSSAVPNWPFLLDCAVPRIVLYLTYSALASDADGPSAPTVPTTYATDLSMFGISEELLVAHDDWAFGLSSASAHADGKPSHSSFRIAY